MDSFAQHEQNCNVKGHPDGTESRVNRTFAPMNCTRRLPIESDGACGLAETATAISLGFDHAGPALTTLAWGPRRSPSRAQCHPTINGTARASGLQTGVFAAKHRRLAPIRYKETLQATESRCHWAHALAWLQTRSDSSGIHLDTHVQKVTQPQ